MRLWRALALIALCLLPAEAFAQATPSGKFTPGHTYRNLVPDGTVFDDAGGAAGGPAGTGLTELGITNTGLPLCINDAPTTGPYHQLCIGASASGGGLVSFNPIGGATPTALNFNINGQTYPFPPVGMGSSIDCILTGFPVAGHGLCLDITVTLAGTYTGGPTTANFLHTINTGANSGSNNFTSTLLIDHEFGGALVLGGQNSLEVDGYFDKGPTSATNGNRNYVGVFGQMVGLNGDGGTDPTTAATSKGALFGSNLFGDAKVGIAWLNVSGGEINVALESGTTALEKTGLQIVDHALDQVHATYVDAALAIGSHPGAIGFNNAILLSNGNGDKPLTTIGCVICTTANNQTIATGIDLSQYNITGFFLKSVGFYVTGAGAISGAGIFNIGANPGPGVQPNMVGSFQSSNFTNGLGEEDYINLSNDAGGHYWYQRSAASGGSYKLLAALSTLGLNVTGGVTAGLGFAAPLVTESPSTAACAAGQIAWDANFIAVCVATNTWKHVAIITY